MLRLPYLPHLPYLEQELNPYITALKNLTFLAAEFARQEVLPLLLQVSITLFAIVFFLLGFAVCSLRLAVEFIDDVVFQEMQRRNDAINEYLAVQPSAVPIGNVNTDVHSEYLEEEKIEEEKAEEKTLTTEEKTTAQGPRFVDLPFIPYDPSNYQTGKMIAAFRNMFVDDETFEYVMYFLASTFDLTPKPRRLLFIRNNGCSGYTTLFGHHARALGSYSAVIPSGVLCKEDDTGFGSCIHFHNYTDKTFIRYSEGPSSYELAPEYVNAIVGSTPLMGKNAYSVLNDYESSAQQLIELRGKQTPLQSWKIGSGKLKYIRYLRMKVEFSNVDSNPEVESDDSTIRKPDASLYQLLRKESSIRRYRGYMRWMCQKLYDDYAGDIDTVPHDVIRKETSEFMQGN